MALNTACQSAVPIPSPSAWPGTRSTSLPSGSVWQTPNGPEASRRLACSTAAAGRTTSRWMRFRSGRGSADCRIRIAGLCRNGSAKPPSSPGASSSTAAARTASPQSGARCRTRRSGAAARQGSQSARDPARQPTAPRRCWSESRRTRMPVAAQVDHDLGRQLHDATGQRSPVDQRRRVERCRRNAVDHPPIRSDLCHAGTVEPIPDGRAWLSRWFGWPHSPNPT